MSSLNSFQNLYVCMYYNWVELINGMYIAAQKCIHILYQLFQYFSQCLLYYCILILKRRGRVLKYLLFYAQVAPAYDRRSKQSKRLLIFSKRRKTHSMLCTPLRHVVKATSNIYVPMLYLIHIVMYFLLPCILPTASPLLMRFLCSYTIEFSKRFPKFPFT